MPPLPVRVLHALTALPLALAAFAGLADPGGPGGDSTAPETAADGASAMLRESLERDRARVIELIRRAPDGQAGALADDVELREIAERMPRTQAALLAEPTEESTDPAAAPDITPRHDANGQPRADTP